MFYIIYDIYTNFFKIYIILYETNTEISNIYNDWYNIIFIV